MFKKDIFFINFRYLSLVYIKDLEGTLNVYC